MRICVESDGMSFLLCTFHQMVVLRIVSRNKERLFYILFLQDIQDLLRIGGQSVIKGKINHLFLPRLCSSKRPETNSDTTLSLLQGSAVQGISAELPSLQHKDPGVKIPPRMHAGQRVSGAGIRCD